MDCYDWTNCPDDCDACPINEYFQLEALDVTTYDAYLAFVEKLVAIDPHLNSPEGIALDWAARDVQYYEKINFPVDSDGGG
jgi:hypothetical protein